ncbi:YvrJ family protein [Bacillus mycoides]|uniref:YvrJ family protein n=1 Tax=Bacillus mycoides TaxID=1405 RepID=UPI0036E8E76B
MDLTLEMWASLLGNFGFPVVITIYLLIRFEKKLDKLTDIIDDLKDTFNQKS